MGDHADDAVDMALNGPFNYWGPVDYDDDGTDFWGFSGGRRASRRRPPLKKTCYNCGEENLRWGNVKGGEWRLFTTDGNLHECDNTISAFRKVK